jgi:hypothetical protein
MSKQTTHKLHTEKSNLRKLNIVEGKEQYQNDISDRIADLKNLDEDEYEDDDVDINRIWERF